MAFKAAVIAHAPNAEPEKHQCMIETSKYRLFTVLVKDQAQAVKECKKLVNEEGVRSILLCPGFTHRATSEIAEAVGENVAVAVARGDGPSSKVSREIRKSERWFSEERRK